MPNETLNILEIKGNKHDIDNFINSHTVFHNDTKYWDFEVSVPINHDLYIKNKNNALFSSKLNNIKKKYWGTTRGIIIETTDNVIKIETPWTSCNQWFKTMIKKYPNLNFVLKYNDEFGEEFYGWEVSYNSKIIASDIINLRNYNDIDNK